MPVSHHAPFPPSAECQSVSRGADNGGLDVSTTQEFVLVRHRLEGTGLRSIDSRTEIDIVDHGIANALAVYSSASAEIPTSFGMLTDLCSKEGSARL